MYHVIKLSVTENPAWFHNGYLKIVWIKYFGLQNSAKINHGNIFIVSMFTLNLNQILLHWVFRLIYFKLYYINYACASYFMGFYLETNWMQTGIKPSTVGTVGKHSIILPNVIPEIYQLDNVPNTSIYILEIYKLLENIVYTQKFTKYSKIYQISSIFSSIWNIVCHDQRCYKRTTFSPKLNLGTRC